MQVLAVGAREMVREKAIVSRLSALEELSGMEILCSDKARCSAQPGSGPWCMAVNAWQ